MDRGGDDASAQIEGDRLRRLVEVAAGLDTALRAFGRRNLPLRPFLEHVHRDTGLLPLYHVARFETGHLALYGR